MRRSPISAQFLRHYVLSGDTQHRDMYLYQSQQFAYSKILKSSLIFPFPRICHVWQCPVLDRCVNDILYSWTIGHRDGDMDKQTQLGKALLSVFVLVDLESDNRSEYVVSSFNKKNIKKSIIFL